MPPGMGPMRGPRHHRPLTEEEKQQAPKLSAPLVKRIFSYLRPYWRRLILVMLIILVSAGVGLLPSILTGRMIDDGLIAGQWEVLVQLIILSLLVTLVSNLIHILQSYLNATIAQNISYDMKNEMYAHLQRMSHRVFPI